MSSPKSPSVRFDDGLLVLDGVTGQPVVPFPREWRFDSRTNAWSTYARNYKSCVVDQDFRNEYRDNVPNWPSVKLPECNLHTLHDFQAEAVHSWNDAEYSGLICFATGLGKTQTALHLIHQMSCSTLVVSPVRDLMYQWSREIKQAFGYEPGIIGDSTRTIRAISCTTYKSAFMHMNELGNRFQFIIFDEAHHLASEKVANAAHFSAAPYRLGLSATTTIEQQAFLKPLLGPVIAEKDVKESAGKHLADYDIFRVPVTLEPETRIRYQALGKIISNYWLERRADNPSFDWEMMCREGRTSQEARRILMTYRQRRRIEERAVEKLRVLEDILELHGRVPTIIFTPSNAAAFDVARRFLIPCILTHSKGPEREEILNGFKEGRYPAVVVNEVWDEGVNVPFAKLAICLGGRKGTRQDIQRLGRVLRRQGNQKACYYDVFCEDTGEEVKTKAKKNIDAYSGSSHLRIQK